MSEQYDQLINDGKLAPEVGPNTFAKTNPPYGPQQQPSSQKAAAHHTTADGAPQEWRIGDVILDQYEVMGTLGEGGMGPIL